MGGKWLLQAAAAVLQNLLPESGVLHLGFINPTHTPRPIEGGEGPARERARANRPHSSTRAEGGGGVSRGKGWVSVWGVVGVTPGL